MKESDKEKRTLAIVGASYLQLPLVKRAKAMGLRTVCFSWPEGAVCKDVCDRFYPFSIVEKEKILAACQAEKIDGITSIASDVAVPTIAYVAKAMGLPGNTEETAFRCTNKNAMRQALKVGGLDIPASAEICLSDDVEAIKRKLSRMRFPLIAKPSDRSGSLGVTKCETRAELEAAIKTALECSLSGSAVVEEFIEDAREISVEGISFAGKYYPLAITDKVTTRNPHFVELAHHEPADWDGEMKTRAIDCARRAVSALGVTIGATHTEMMIDREGRLFITEVGARMGGDFIGSDLVKLSTGYDFVHGVIQCALGEFDEPILRDAGCSGVLFSSVVTPEVRKILESGKAEKEPWCVRAEITGNEIKPELLCSADRDGYVIYKADHRICNLEKEMGMGDATTPCPMDLTGKRLLIISGVALHQKVVRAARKLGVHAIVTDFLSFDDAPAKKIADEAWMVSTMDIDAVVEKCKAEHIDGVLNYCIDTAQHPYQQVAESLGLPCFGTREQFEILTDKRKFKDFCRKCDVDVIPEYTKEDLESGKVRYPVVVKPSMSRGSRGQSVCRNKDEVLAAIPLARETSVDGNIIIERHMGGCQDMALAYIVVAGEPYLVKIGDRYLGKACDNLDRQQISTVLPSVNTGKFLTYSDIKIKAMIKTLGIRFGAVFCQGFWEDGRIYLYDPGLRFPGSDFDLALEKATGFDSISSCIRFALTGDAATTFSSPEKVYDYAGKTCVILSIASHPGTIATFEGFDEVAADPRVVSSTKIHKEGDEIPATGDIRQRVAEFVALVPERKDVRAFCEFVYSRIKVLDRDGTNMSVSQLNDDDINNITGNGGIHA